MPRNISFAVLMRDRYSRVADKVAKKTVRLSQKMEVLKFKFKRTSTEMRNANGRLKIFGRSARKAGRDVGFLGQNLSGMLRRVGPAMLAFKALQVSGENQKMVKSFQVMTGDKVVGKELNLDLQDFASKTHYNIPQVQQTAKTLLAYGIPVENILDAVKTVGSISAGSGADIKRIALAYGQMTSTGFLQGQDARQFESSGVGIRKLVQEKVFELTGEHMEMGDIMKAVSTRAIPSAFIHEILTDLVSEGGRFHGILEEINDTLPGQFSNLFDNFIRIGII